MTPVTKEIIEELREHLHIVEVDFNELSQISPFMKMMVRHYVRNRFAAIEMQKSIEEIGKWIEKKEMTNETAQELWDATNVRSRLIAHLDLMNGAEKLFVESIFAGRAFKNSLEKDIAKKVGVQ